MGFGSILNTSIDASVFDNASLNIKNTSDKKWTSVKITNSEISKTVSLSNLASVSVDCWGTGTYSFSFTGGGVTSSTSVKVDSIKIYDVECEWINPILNNCSWADISAKSKAGTASSYWSVGDAKRILVKGNMFSLSVNGYYWVYILGFDHNPNIEGYNRIHFMLGRTTQNYTGSSDICFVDKFYGSTSPQSSYPAISNMPFCGWPTDATDSYDYTAAAFYTLCGEDITDIKASSFSGKAAYEIPSCLPSDLRAVMRKFVKKYVRISDFTSSPNTVYSATNWMHIPNTTEIAGYQSSENFQPISGEYNNSKQYQYYKSGNTIKRYKHNSTGTSAKYWLRTQSKRDPSYHVYIKNGRLTSTAFPYFVFGICAIFCV